MTIYEIDLEIQRIVDAGVDPETGEFLFDPETLEELQMERDRKVENLALAWKNLTAEAAAIAAEEKALAQRRRAAEAKADRAKEYLEYVLQGEAFKTSKVAVSYRKTKKLSLAPDWVKWAAVAAPDFLRYKDPEPDRVAITAALRSGQHILGAELIENSSTIIK